MLARPQAKVSSNRLLGPRLLGALWILCFVTVGALVLPANVETWNVIEH